MTTALKAAPRKVKAPQPRNTLQTLWRCVYLIWVLDAVLLAAAIGGVTSHGDVLEMVAEDSAPNIMAAEEIKYELADMDANAANELLGEPDQDAYDKARNEAARSLIEAARNTTKNEDENILSIQTNLGQYEIQIQKARDRSERKDKLFVNDYLAAAAIMDKKLLTSADDLSRRKNTELETAYKSLSRRSGITIFGILAAGIALLGTLFSVQRYLNQKTHRILNPLLIAATLITLSFVGYTVSRLDAESRHLKIAKKDAFDSISALLQARATAYAAKADESRFLLDPSHAQEHEAAFFSKTRQLARIPVGMTAESLAASEIRGHKVPGFEGFLADELRNITFDGEGTTAADTLRHFVEYLKIDQDIRQYEKQGDHAAAIKLCVGKSNDVFDQFNKALKDTLTINQKAFHEETKAGSEALSNFEIKASLVALVIAALSYFGLLQRIREYQ